MKAKLEKVPYNLASSITVKREVTPYMDYPWHYHPEYEIIFVEKSYGIRFMGNHIGNFDDGDLMFISSDLPHVWKNDTVFYQNDKNFYVDVYVIHFREDALTKEFFNLPELAHIKRLFTLGKQGFLITGIDHKKISDLVKRVVNSSGMDRLVLFLETLDAIATTKDYNLLSTPGYINSINNFDTDRLNSVINFVMENYAYNIDIEEVANLANLTISSFCRYFKSRTHKTYSQFLNEIRILNASKLLTNTTMTISEICFKTGYNNISHFNRQFKLVTGLTANAYKKKFLKAA